MSQFVRWPTQPVGVCGALPLPTGAATAGHQLEEIALLGQIVINTGGTPATYNTKSVYSAITAVASGSETQIVSYTVPVGKSALLVRTESSGDNIAAFRIYRDAAVIDTKRSEFTALNVRSEFTSGGNESLLFVAGEVIKITVLHSRSSAGNFEGRIQIVEIG